MDQASKRQKKENFRAKYSSQKAEKMTTDLKVLTEEGFLVNTETMSLSKPSPAHLWSASGHFRALGAAPAWESVRTRPPFSPPI